MLCHPWARPLLVAAALLVTGCGGARATPPVVDLPAAADGGAVSTAALNAQLFVQTTPPQEGQDLSIGPGDLIEISVFEVEELTGLKVRVPLRGTITLPLLGQIPATGLTAFDLEETIRRRLQQKYMHDPQVSVFVAEQKSQRVSVIGSVRRGGVYPMTSQLRLADGLALAEGLADDADHVVYLIRRVPAGSIASAQSGQAAPVPVPDGPTEAVTAAIDLEELARGREELNVPLQAGDVIQVPKAGSYYVSGSVEKPGSFFLKARTSLQQAITAAGGVTNSADWDDVRVYRARADGTREILDFSLSAIEDGAPAPDIQKNDVVVVGKSYAKAFFFGVTDFLKGIFGFSKGL